MATAKQQDSSGTLEMSSSSSDKESSCRVESPSEALKDDELFIAEMPSPASSKAESPFPVESPPGSSKDGEERDIPEMPSPASGKEESPFPVESPPGTSKNGDEIDILSSKTESPTLISTVYSSCSQATAESITACLKCFDRVCTWIESLVCFKKKRASRYNFLILVIGFLLMILACILLKNDGVLVFWEFFYASILVMYSSILTCCLDRGCCSQSPCITRDPSGRGCCSGGGCVDIISPAFQQRKTFYSHATLSEEESSKDEVLAAFQADTPEHESNVEMDIAENPEHESNVEMDIAENPEHESNVEIDIAENPGTSLVRVEIAIIE